MKTILKVALATCGLMGSISYNSGVETEYLEDDALFGKTSEQQDLGWSWGLNSAHAVRCQSTLSCAMDQSDGDNDVDVYAECMDWAQTPEEEEFCERYL
jgi:hypothetical protein